jgi:hypothetical protein
MEKEVLMTNKHTYYMPLGAHEVLEWARNFIAVARANEAAFGFSCKELDPLAAAADALATALAQADGETASKEDIRHKNTLLKTTRHQFQTFVNTRVNYNERIDDEGRAALRTHVKDSARTPIPAPTDQVRLRVTPLAGHAHRIDFTSMTTGKKSIPYGMNGVVLARQVLEDGAPVPATGEELAVTELVTSSPHTTDYPPTQAGRRAAYSAAWQNERGTKGRFSDVEVHVVP